MQQGHARAVWSPAVDQHTFRCMSALLGIARETGIAGIDPDHSDSKKVHLSSFLQSHKSPRSNRNHKVAENRAQMLLGLHLD